MVASGHILLYPALPALMAATLGIGHPAEASVYSFTANDGTVNLSNVPADDRYQLLVRAPVVKAAAPEANPSPAIAKKARYDRAVEKVAVTYGLDSALLHAVITVESRYRSKAVSRKGAAGLMQLMPNIVRRYGVADPLDPLQNLHGGARYLQYLLKRYDNDVSLALAAYNSGETAVAKYGNRIPPYRETTNYVPQVLDLYRKYRGESF